MEKTTLYLPEGLHQRLRQESRRTGRPQAEIVREALDAYFADKPRTLPRSLGLGNDPDLSGADVDDWLRDNWQPG
jgi:hypothetical protein